MIALVALFCSCVVSPLAAQSQEMTLPDTIYNPEVSYAKPIHKTIAAIEIEGVRTFDDFVLRNLSGLAVGDEVLIPGDAMSAAVNRIMRQGYFSNARIVVDKYVGSQVYLRIIVTERPRISQVTFSGVKKSEREDLELRSGLRQGTQMTRNNEDKVKQIIQKYFNDKGFRDAKVTITQEPDLSKEGYVNVAIAIEKKHKTKVNDIYFSGNNSLSDHTLRMAMKNTNAKFSLKKHIRSSFLKLFSSKKFVEESYREDLTRLVEKYQEYGFRDAEVIADSVVRTPDGKRVNIYLNIDEGQKYYIKDINFVGNSQYPAEYLDRVLGIKSGDVYNQRRLAKRLNEDEDAVGNLYYNNGYIFAWVDPVETNVVGDSVSLDIRIAEGKPANINKVIIKGNTVVYDEVVRRELYTKPGQLFSREDIINSIRLINQLGHFDAEKSVPRPIPNQESGTVDIEYDLVPRSSDQLELSMGWSQSGLLFRGAIKFTNFSVGNLLHPSMYKKGIIPQGDGQTLSLSAQTNGKYYQQYSISFMDPWFGGKRPDMFSVSAFYSKTTAIDSKFYNSNASNYYNAYYNSYYNNYNSYYNGMGNYASDLYTQASDPDKSLQMLGASIGYGKRLTWPDNWFQIYASLNYTYYKLRNWSYNTFQNFHHGSANDLNLELRLSRTSIDNPIYTRSGSDFMVSVAATLPYSLWDNLDYASSTLNVSDRYRFIEYHKWKFRGRVFTPLINPATHKYAPVLMGRVEGAILGSYNLNKKSPFGTFYMGGDGMSSYYGGYMNETIGLRGYKNGTIAGNNYDYAYAYMRLSMELRFPILFENSFNAWVLAFAEAGNAWRNIDNYSPFNLKRSAGVGLRVPLPMVGMLGNDWGYGFDRPDNSTVRGGSNIHFVLGQEI